MFFLRDQAVKRIVRIARIFKNTGEWKQLFNHLRAWTFWENHVLELQILQKKLPFKRDFSTLRQLFCKVVTHHFEGNSILFHMTQLTASKVTAVGSTPTPSHSYRTIGGCYTLLTRKGKPWVVIHTSALKRNDARVTSTGSITTMHRASFPACILFIQTDTTNVSPCASTASSYSSKKRDEEKHRLDKC